jgi:formylglycine-generating enzyme required for sulfatase activity
MKTVALAMVMGASALVQIGAAASQSASRFPMWDAKEPVAEYAQRAKLASTLTLNLGDGVTWEGVLVPAGTFVMGSPPGEARTEQESLLETRHKVTISRPFYMGKYELTQAQFEGVMGVNPSLTKGSNLPVHNVSWQDAQTYCERLGTKVGRQVQLPTEAQWEYACRAGTTTAYYSGNQISDLDKVGWHAGNSERRPHPVGQLMPNRFGLYDMHGNIREFVRDYFDGKPLADAIDPTGPADGDPNNHVVRGGAYSANAAVAGNCRAAIRRPTEVLTITGFRIMVPLTEETR